MTVDWNKALRTLKGMAITNISEVIGEEVVVKVGSEVVSIVEFYEKPLALDSPQTDVGKLVTALPIPKSELDNNEDTMSVTSDVTLSAGSEDDKFFAENATMTDSKSRGILESLKDFQSDLDAKNTLALNELNRQIDELATIPLRNLDPYTDSIEYIGPPKGTSDSKTSNLLAAKDPNLTLQLDQDLKDLRALTNQAIPDAFMDSKLDSFLASPSRLADISGGDFKRSSMSNSEGLSNETKELLKQLEANYLPSQKEAPAVESPTKDPKEFELLHSLKLSKETQELLKKMVTVRNDNEISPEFSKETADMLHKLRNSDNESPMKTAELSTQSSTKETEKQFEYTNHGKSKLSKLDQVHISQETLTLLDNLKNQRYEQDPIVPPEALQANFSLLQKLETKSELDQPKDILKAPITSAKVFRPTTLADSPLVSMTNLLSDAEFTKEKINAAKQSGKSKLATELSKEEPELPKPRLRDNDSVGTSEEDSRAIVNALRTLQERVGRLETEKQVAKEKIHLLEEELLHTRQLLHKQQLKEQQSSAEKNYNTDYTLSKISDARADIEALKTKVENVSKFSNNFDPKYAPDYSSEMDYHLKETADNIRMKMQQEKIHQDQNGYQSSGYPLKNQGTSPFREPQRTNPARETVGTSPLRDSIPVQEVPSYSPIMKSKVPELKKSTSSPKKPAAERDLSSPLGKLPTPSSPQKLSNLKQKGAFLAEDEINQLKLDIENEREIRRANVFLSNQNQESDAIKKKLLAKIKAESAGKNTGLAVPEWKTKSRSQSTNAGTMHTRKRAPIDVPKVLGEGEESGKREMPFIVGRNTGKSFSVTANLQKVFSMLKAHNPELCSVCSKRSGHCAGHHVKEVAKESRPVHVLDGESSKEPRKLKIRKSIPRENFDGEKQGNNETSDNLFQMLTLLESEFAEGKQQYAALVRQYETVAESITSKSVSESQGTNTLKAIGDDLRTCIQSLETKSEQIKIIRGIMGSSLSLQQRKREKTEPKKAQAKHYTMDTITSRSRSREIPNSQSAARLRTRSQSPGKAMASLSLLKSTLKVQDVLGI